MKHAGPLVTKVGARRIGVGTAGPCASTHAAGLPTRAGTAGDENDCSSKNKKSFHDAPLVKP